MRLEFNPSALCYNLYCGTREEHDKLKQMLEKPLTATDIKSIDKMIYADTDSIKTMKTKLNSEYGRMVMTNKEYIVVHRAKKPIVIFTKSILAIEKYDDGTAVIYCSDNAVFYADEKYVDVIKQLV